MCDPTTLVAGAVLSGAGAYSKSQAGKKATDAQQRAIDQGTTLSRQEFDRRYKAIGESDSRIDRISREGFNETEGLEARAFSDNIESNDAGFRELLALDQDVSGRGFGKTIDTYDGLADVGRERDEGVSGAALRLRGATDAEAVRQEAFQQDADHATNRLLAGLGREDLERGRQRNAGGITALAEELIGDEAVPGYAALDSSGDAVQREIERNVSEAADRQKGMAAAGAQIGSFDAALMEADRAISRTEGTLDRLGAQSESSNAALDPELDVGRVAKLNANEKAAQARSSAITEVESFLDRLSTERELKRGHLTEFRGRDDAARNTFYNKAGDNMRNFYGSQLGAEKNFASALNANSAQFENTNRNLTQFKVNNTTSSDPFGDILSSVGGKVMQSSF